MSLPRTELRPRIRFVGLYRHYTSVVLAVAVVGGGAVLVVSFVPEVAAVLFERLIAILIGFVGLTLPVLVAVDALTRLLPPTTAIHSRVTLAVAAVPLSLLWAAVWLEAVNVSGWVDEPWPLTLDLVALLGLGAWAAVAFTLATARVDNPAGPGADSR